MERSFMHGWFIGPVLSRDFCYGDSKAVWNLCAKGARPQAFPPKVFVISGERLSRSVISRGAC